MKKVLALLLTLVLTLTLSACSLFSDTSIVKFEELYTHKDPSGLKYTERKTLMNKSFGTMLTEMVNSMAYPDNMKYDEQGNIIGMYDYDPATGKSMGWTDMETGEFIAEETDLGLPDESLMLKLSGDVLLGGVVYGNEDKAVCAYVYAFLTDAADQEAVKTSLESFYGLSMTAEKDTVLVCKQDEAAVNARFTEYAEVYGMATPTQDASAYAELLQLELGLRFYGVNPFKPTDAAKDPTDIQYDTKQVLTSSGAYSFADSSLESGMKGRTDVIYGYQGKAVAHYTYYEYNTREGADKLMEFSVGNFFTVPERLSDTVVMEKQVGQELADTISLYIGYQVLKDDSYDSYVTNVEESFFMMRYEN